MIDANLKHIIFVLWLQSFHIPEKIPHFFIVRFTQMCRRFIQLIRVQSVRVEIRVWQQYVARRWHNGGAILLNFKIGLTQ